MDLSQSGVLAFIEDAYRRGLTRDQVTDALLAHGYTVKQIADAVLAEYGNDRFGGWKVFDDAELLEFLNRR